MKKEIRLLEPNHSGTLPGKYSGDSGEFEIKEFYPSSKWFFADVEEYDLDDDCYNVNAQFLYNTFEPFWVVIEKELVEFKI